jgi:hypothetical protein
MPPENGRAPGQRGAREKTRRPTNVDSNCSTKPFDVGHSRALDTRDAVAELLFEVLVRLRQIRSLTAHDDLPHLGRAWMSCHRAAAENKRRRDLLLEEVGL